MLSYFGAESGGPSGWTEEILGIWSFHGLGKMSWSLSAVEHKFSDDVYKIIASNSTMQIHLLCRRFKLT